MLKVQIMIGTVEIDLMNGSIHSMYHGYTTGAHKSDAAIGQANASEGASEDASADFLLIQIAVTMPDRKSTRLNSSHGYISYAVFCLKKKHRDQPQPPAGLALEEVFY